MNSVVGACRCPAHSQAYGGARRVASAGAGGADYAFEMATSSVRVGPGVTQEIGYDMKYLGAKKVCVFTDATLLHMKPVRAVLESLDRHGVAPHAIYSHVAVEPTDESFQHAIAFARQHRFDAYVAVGGGSVIDTAKAANLYAADPEADFLDYVNAPIGRGKPVTAKLAPLIAVPTTAGTGSETTGVAIFGFKDIKTKTGIANRALRPTLGLIDPDHALSMPRNVAAYSGFDVLCHALESYTAIPYHRRTPRPAEPLLRPVYQGANPVSDVWSLEGLRLCAKYLPRAVKDNDPEARRWMLMASTFAGIGFGNAGVHLCHAMSYPISGNMSSFFPAGYPADRGVVPHGLAVVMTAPAVFKFTAAACPERHLQAAAILGADVSNAKAADAGLILSDTLRKFLHNLDVENGLAGLGYTAAAIPALVEGTLPQHRVTKLSPQPVGREEITAILQDSLRIY